MSPWSDRDARVFLTQAGSTPGGPALVSAKGSWVEDETGHRFLDFHGNTCHNIGYRHPRLVAALHAQLDCLPFTARGFTNRPAVELAEVLSSLWPWGAARVLFAPSGTDAIELALKLAYVATGRKRTIAFEDSWHGAALGALWVGGRPSERGDFPCLEGCRHAPPFWPRSAAETVEGAARVSLAALRGLLAEPGGFACLLAEPIRSTPHRPPDWFWPEVAEACRAAGTLLVLDEVPTGLGKTGRLFSASHFDVAPDITVLGKSLGGAALPLAAVIARAELDVTGHLAIGHITHQKNPMLCQAGVTTLGILAHEALPERAARLGAETLERLHALVGDKDDLVGARGVGLLMAVEFGDPARARAARAACFAAGLNASTSEGRFLTLSPPLTIPESDMDHALAILSRVLR
jgi:4-aminobutyrate aminotransferase